MLKKYAQEIADSTADAIGYPVFITDMDGIIIGCSDPDRGLGTLHEASLRAINMGCGYLEDEEEAKKFRGTKMGATYPIEDSSGKIVGTVAITGDSKKVAPFALVVKKQAEILLREKLLLELMLNQERTLQHLIQNIANFDSQTENAALLTDRAKYFGYDEKLTYIVLAVELAKSVSVEASRTLPGADQNKEIVAQALRTKTLLQIRNMFNKPQDISTVLGDNNYVIMRALFPNILHDKQSLWENIYRECSKIKDILFQDGLQINIGVGSISNSIMELAISYRESWEAIVIGKSIRADQGIYFIHDYRVEEIFLTANRRLVRQHISMHLEKLQGQNDWLELKDTIVVWCESQFNIAQAAAKLYIHRNTLDYRLTKIENICGINPRIFRQALKLYTAIQMDYMFSTGLEVSKEL